MMDVRTVPVYTAREFSELTGIPIKKALTLADGAQPNRRIFSWSDTLRKLAEDLGSRIYAEKILRRGGRAYRDLDESLEHISVDPKRLSASPK